MAKHYFRTPEYFKQIIASENEFNYVKTNAKKWRAFIIKTMESKPWDIASEEIYNHLETEAPNIFNKLFGVCYTTWVVSTRDLSRLDYAYAKYGRYISATFAGERDDVVVEENFAPIFFVSNGMNMDYTSDFEQYSKEWLSYYQARPDDYKNVLVRFLTWIQNILTLDEFNAKVRDEYVHKTPWGGCVPSSLVEMHKKGIYYPKPIP